MPAALGLLSEIVIDPRFPESEVQRVRNEQLGEIEQRKSDPRSLASDEAVRFIYGADATYGRPTLGNRETVERLTAGDVRAFYHDRYAPGSAALVLVGALDDATRAASSEQISAWQAQLAPARSAQETTPPAGPVVHVVDRPGAVQSEIRIGHPGPTRADPDYFALQVLNSILGGAFTSRLNMNLREKQGFTYGVRSNFAFRKGPGPFLISTAVASDVTARAIEEILKEIDALRADGPTEEEMRNTRDYLAGILPLELQTTNQLATRLSELFIYNLPDRYFDTYRERIAAVTRDDAHRVAQQHIARERLTFVVVGDASQIVAPLRDLGLGPLDVHDSHE
jgi:zinc protease